MNNERQENTTECGATSKATNDRKIQHGKEHTFKFDKKFLRIEYPGVVQNIDKAMETFGGIERVEMVKVKTIKSIT